MPDSGKELGIDYSFSGKFFPSIIVFCSLNY